MYNTARIAAIVALASCLSAVPARALSVRDWEAKSDRDQIEYLGACFARLVTAVGKTDQPLSQKIKSYYYDKTPGVKYPAGFLDVLQQIVRTQQQAETDRRIDLSKIEIEDLVLRTTAERFKLPDTVTNAGKSAGTAPPAPAKPDFQPAAPPRPKLIPRPSANHPAGAESSITPPTAAPKQTAQKKSAPNDDPIGAGGFIAPPARAPAPEKKSPPVDDSIGAGGFIGPPIYQVRDHDPRWYGRAMVIEGTVLKVAVSKTNVAHILFREAADGSFQVLTPLVGELRARYGADFAGLIGKTIRVDGKVLHFVDTEGGIRFVDLEKLKLVP